MKELQNKSYEELVQLQQDGKITLVEFVEAQPELCLLYTSRCV